MALKHGEGIRVIELNGLTSEATFIYHPHTPLLTTCKTLVSHWRRPSRSETTTRSTARMCRKVQKSWV